jgi:hypothetical protein
MLLSECLSLGLSVHYRNRKAEIEKYVISGMSQKPMVVGKILG